MPEAWEEACGRAGPSPPVPPFQVKCSLCCRTALPPQHRCCLFLLPTHPVYLKRPRDKSHAGRVSERPILLRAPGCEPAEPCCLPPGANAVLRHELLPNYKHLLTSTPIPQRPRSSWRGAERCQPHREQCVRLQPPPGRGCGQAGTLAPTHPRPWSDAWLARGNPLALASHPVGLARRARARFLGTPACR